MMPDDFVLGVLGKPDQTDWIKRDGLKISYRNGNPVPLVIVNTTPNYLEAVFAIWVYQDVREEPIDEDMAPIGLLRIFLDRFGVDVTAGGITKKLFHLEQVPLDPASGANVISHGPGVVLPFSASSPVGGMVEIGLAFAIDAIAYSDWVLAH